MEILVKKCNNCPFLSPNFDDYALGDDTLLECNLKRYLGLNETFIGGFNSATEEIPNVNIPDDCPIKDVNIKISTND